MKLFLKIITLLIAGFNKTLFFIEKYLSGYLMVSNLDNVICIMLKLTDFGFFEMMEVDILFKKT